MVMFHCYVSSPEGKAFWGWLISAIRTNVSHFLCDHGPSWKQNFQVHHPSVHERLVTQFLRRDLIHEDRPTLPSVLSPIDICRKTCWPEDSGIVGIGIAKAWCDTSEKGIPWRQAHCPLWSALRWHHLGMGTAKLAWFLTVLILYLFEPCWRLIFVLQQQL